MLILHHLKLIGENSVLDIEPRTIQKIMKVFKQRIPRKLKKKCKTAYNKTMLYRGLPQLKRSEMRILEADGEGYVIQL